MLQHQLQYGVLAYAHVNDLKNKKGSKQWLNDMDGFRYNNIP